MRRSSHESHEVLTGKKILLVGNPDAVHVGAHLHQAAEILGLCVMFSDSRRAFAGPACLVKFNWWVRGHRPPRLRVFSQEVVQACREFRPLWMLVTGLAPLDASALQAIGQLGVKRLNYLTDDPLNPEHRSPWFLKALPHYEHVFSPRRANMEDLRRLGCPAVSYVPFAYAPELHFPEPSATAEEQTRFAAEVVFAGGADRDRAPYMAALLRAGFKVALYGGYWERYPGTKAHAQGHADPQTLRKAIRGAKVALCLVRRANRDGHAMRTFEVPAIGACMLVEDTEEHREIFGEDEVAVAYFCDVDDMIEKLHWLLAHDDERQRLAQTAHYLITQGTHTYRDRLMAMLALAGAEV
jgi:spore maturation protein CgeB